MDLLRRRLGGVGAAGTITDALDVVLACKTDGSLLSALDPQSEAMILYRNAQGFPDHFKAEAKTYLRGKFISLLDLVCTVRTDTQFWIDK